MSGRGGADSTFLGRRLSRFRIGEAAGTQGRAAIRPDETPLTSELREVAPDGCGPDPKVVGDLGDGHPTLLPEQGEETVVATDSRGHEGSM